MEVCSHDRDFGFAALAAVLLGIAVASAGCDPGGTPVEGDADANGWELDGGGEVADDAEPDARGASEFSLQLGRPADQGMGFEPYASSDPELEIVRGFQGGFHLEPSLYITELDRRDFTAVIDYQVVRLSDGESLIRPTEYTIDQAGWISWADGYVHHSNPVIFTASQPSEVTGTEVRLQVTVRLEGGGRTRASLEATLVNGEGP